MATLSSDMDVFCKILISSKSPGILTGAGLSAGSGIRTYRGADGEWNITDPFSVASLAAFQEDPSCVWRHFRSRREEYLNATPNAAHTALASLFNPSVCRLLLPSMSDQYRPPLYITQNVDGLSRRSVDECIKPLHLDTVQKQAASDRLIEMHGSCYRTICLQCRAIKTTSESLLAEVFAPDSLMRLDHDNKRVPVEQLPRCGGPNWAGSNRYGRCGGLLRPGIVWFGEVPEGQGEIVRNLTKVDVLLVIGTSSLVHPAATCAQTVRKNGGTVAVFNLGVSKGDEQADFTFYGPCEETIPLLFEKLGNLALQQNTV